MKDLELKGIEILDDLSHPERDAGRVAWIKRLRVRNAFVDGSFSRPYNVDIVSHKGIDAVAILPYWRDDDGRVQLMLLRSFRPALTFRDADPESEPYLIEAIAGILERGEGSQGRAGIRHRAAREALEEAGIEIPQETVAILGEPFFTSPGVYTEKLWVTAAEVDPGVRNEPSLDGSVMEEMIRPLVFSLEEARLMCDTGEIRDAKTEIAIERLARLLDRTGKKQEISN